MFRVKYVVMITTHTQPNFMFLVPAFRRLPPPNGNKKKIQVVGILLIYSFEKHLNESFVFYDLSLLLHGSSKQRISRGIVASTSLVHTVFLLLL